MSKTRLRTRATFAVSRTIGVTEYSTKAAGVFFRSYSNYTATPGSDVTSMERTWDKLHPGPPFTSGGPFDCYKSTYPVDMVEGEADYYFVHPGGTTYRYRGGFLPAGFGTKPLSHNDCKNVGLIGPYDRDFGDNYSYGAAAWNKFRPKTSGFDAATALGELRELPGMLADAAKTFSKAFISMGGKKTDLFMPKSIAKEFLGYNFGWVPFVNDLRKLRKTYHAYDRILRRLRRQNNQWVRKGGIVLHTGEVTDRQDNFALDAPAIWPAPPTQLVRFPYSGRPNKWGNTTFETHHETDIWFEGSFKFHIPWMSGGGLPNWRTFQAHQQVYGLRISPSVVWNLTPWSWLADWFTNAGDIIDNVTAINADRLVARYAYIMGRSRVKRLNASTIHFKSGTVNCLWHQLIDVKRRQSASPFGFSLDTESFSKYQWSILAALGLSRGHR